VMQRLLPKRCGSDFFTRPMANSATTFCWSCPADLLRHFTHSLYFSALTDVLAAQSPIAEASKGAIRLHVDDARWPELRCRRGSLGFLKLGTG
jgi:hypothetical protein